MTNPLRRPLIAGNWKMNLDLKASVGLVSALRQAVGDEAGPVDVWVFPPSTALTVAAEALRGSRIRVGGQNLHWEAKGAFTGEVCAPQLLDAGASAVLIGHSERRTYFGDTDDWVRKKLAAALGAGLLPVVCIGETLHEREGQETWRVLERQVRGALEGFAPTQLASLTLAYEPVWAIGTGKTATPAQAEEAHLFVRKLVGRLYGDGLAQSVRVLYGGSVTPENVDSLMAEPDVDGALAGGASLKAESFLRIVRFQPPVAR